MSDKTAPAPDPQKPAAAPPAPDVPPLEAFFKGNRLLSAAILFLLLEAVPVAGLVIALRESGDVWMVFAAVLMAGALLPPVGVLLGQKWGYVLGHYVVWGSLVGVILRVLHTGFSPVYLGPAVLLGVLLVALSTPRTAGEPRKAEKKPESFGVWLKENIEAIVIAFIMALVIRCFCIEVFKIPSSSMEPTLLGDLSSNHSRLNCPFGAYHVPPPPPPPRTDNASGDRIMVTKYYYAFSSIERYDVLVFKFPLNQAKNFIKRVVGLPSEFLQIHRGNLYVSKEKQGPYQIARRTLRTQESLWIDPAKGSPGYLANSSDFNRSWHAEKAPDRKGAAHVDVKDGVLSTLEKDGERSAVFSFGERCLYDGGSTPVDDQRILFEFELTSPKGQVFAEIVNAYGRFEARLDTEGESQLLCHLPVKDGKGRFETKTTLLKDVRLTTDRTYKLELSIFDGMAYVRLNDGERGRFPFITTKEDLVATESPDRRIAFGARGATFKVRNLTLGRDIHYKGKSDRDHGLAEDEPVEIPPDHYLMMGDNVANSHDSRAWVKKTFILEDGREFVCEAQQVNEGMSNFNTQLQKKLGLPNPPRIGIDGDQHGNEIAIMDGQLKDQKSESFRFVHEKYIVGKALWIWWPQGRWFHLIR